MKTAFWRTIGISLALSGIALTVSAQQQLRGFDPAVKENIGGQKNLYEIDTGVYRSAQPRRKSLAALKAAGIQEILNLRRHKNKDAKITHRGDFVLHLVPLKARDINEDSLIEALRVIRNRKGPILIHCWKGSDRTGLVCAMYRILFDHWSKEQAIQEMEEGGFGFHKMYHQVPDYIRQADIPRIRQLVFQ
jgi:protein tyrosine phosphatase (PTP) superfamily phosphohydrolase (DUF442 family)